MTVIVVPATVMAPVRSLAVAFGAITYPTAPVPVPPSWSTGSIPRSGCSPRARARRVHPHGAGLPPASAVIGLSGFTSNVQRRRRTGGGLLNGEAGGPHGDPGGAGTAGVIGGDAIGDLRIAGAAGRRHDRQPGLIGGGVPRAPGAGGQRDAALRCRRIELRGPWLQCVRAARRWRRWRPRRRRPASPRTGRRRSAPCRRVLCPRWRAHEAVTRPGPFPCAPCVTESQSASLQRSTRSPSAPARSRRPTSARRQSAPGCDRD